MAEQRRKEEEGQPLVSYDGGKTWTEALIHRGKPWRWEIILVAGLSMLIGGIGWARTGDVASDAKMAADDANQALTQAETFATDLRDSAVSGCQRQNQVRKQQHVVQNILRDVLHDDIMDSRHPDPAILELLHLTPADVKGVSDKKIERLQQHRQDLNRKLKLAACELIYPQPEEDGPNAG